MLKVQLTPNYAGVTISGDYDDLNFLYDSINYLIVEDANSLEEDIMRNHLYGFLYDVRHAYQGQRDIELNDNSLDDYIREEYGLKHKDITDKNLYFKFNYLLPDLILDMILIKHFIKKVNKKYRDEYNYYINMVNYFYSIVLHSLQGFLTEIQFNKVKNGLKRSYIIEASFIPQWFEIISVDYANMSKKLRKKEFMHIVSAIYDYYLYESYLEIKKDVENECKKSNCTIDCLHYNKYPETIEW